ncbi:MAG: dihydropteroate synthase [Spirochaetaceae bacterium]|jgi:5-methyltetrahydrofolate--homocysteine methyltransferase|nr:dihydropteroate synthase [Spirochaetaceae bacterium]
MISETKNLLLVGESLNGTISKVNEAIGKRDADFVRNSARAQTESGATWLDLNAGAVAGRDEGESLIWLLQTAREATELPFVIDSPSPQVLVKAIGSYKGPGPILSSVTAEEKSLETVMPLTAEYQCGIVGLCMDAEGVPNDSEGRLKAAEKLVASALYYGVALENLYLDPLVMTVATKPDIAFIIRDTIRGIRERYPEIKILTAPSNLSFGMPNRRLLNRTFISMLLFEGIDGIIYNALDHDSYASILASEVLTGKDKRSKNYLKAFREGKLVS